MALILALALAQAAPASDEPRRETTTLRKADARVAEVAFRLASRGASQCPDKYPLTGMLLHHLAEYDDEGRRIQIERYRLDRGPGVLTVVAGGPADRAGLVAGDVLLSVNDAPFADPVAISAQSKAWAWRKMVQGTEWQLEQALQQGPARLKILRQERELDLILGSRPGCPLRVRLAYDRQVNAFAKDGYVIVTTGILDLVRSNDELAVVIGHELAHNLLGHEERLEAMNVPKGLLRGFGKNAARVKATETEADRLGLKLSWAAGYDPRAAIPFWERFYKAVPSGLPIFRTHPGLTARKRLVEEVVAELSKTAIPVSAPAS